MFDGFTITVTREWTVAAAAVALVIGMGFSSWCVSSLVSNSYMKKARKKFTADKLERLNRELKVAMAKRKP